MENQSFSTTILVDQTPQQAFDAINNVRGWWSQNIQGDTDKEGAVFDYSARDLHRCKIKVVELVPGRKVVWQVLENYFKFVTDQTEWVGTRIVFDIHPKHGQTEIQFTHEGLVAPMECYPICENAWTKYTRVSLLDLIATGVGDPNEKE